MVNDAVFHKLDKRVVNYIKQQISINGQNPIKLTYKEIASQLNVSSKTVDYRIQQALKQLRIDLKDYLPLILFLS